MLGVVGRLLRRNVRYVIDLRFVRSLFGEMRGYSIEFSCRRNVRRNVRYICLSWDIVRSLLEIQRYSIELKAVRN